MRNPHTAVGPAVRLACALVLLAPAGPAMAGWSTPAGIPLPAGAGGWYSNAPTIAPLPDGTVVVVANANQSGASRPTAAVLSNGAWTSSYLDAAGADDPLVSWDDTGAAVAVWRKPNGSGRTEAFAARRGANGTWTSEGVISGTLHANYILQGISRGPNGDIAVGLCPGRVPTVVRRVNGAWSTPSTVPGSGLDCDDGSGLFAVAQDADGGTWARMVVGNDMRVAYLDAAGNWQLQETLTPGGSTSFGQQLVVAGDGTPVAMWSTSTGAVTSRARTGGAWGAAQVVDSAATSTQAGTRLAASSYSPTVAGAWRRVDANACGFMCNEYMAKGASRSGATWGAVQVFTPDPQPVVGAPVPGVDAMGGAHVVWRDSSSLSAAGPSGTASTIAASGASDARGIAGDSRGRLVVVYSTTSQGYAASVLTQVPGVPSGVTATPGAAGTIDVAWTAPAADGGEAITRYTATATPGGRTCVASSNGCSITGLDAGTTYSVAVTAANALGTGPTSGAASATTAAAPSGGSPGEGTAAPATPLTATPVPAVTLEPTKPMALAGGSRRIGNTVVSTGTVPDGVSRMVQHARPRVGRTATAETARVRSTRGRCSITPVRDGATAREVRTYRCVIGLRRGLWTITTSGLDASGTILATSTRPVTMPGRAPAPVPVTG